MKKLIAAALIAAIPTAVTAAELKDADAQIKFRKGLMGAIGGSSQGIAALLQGKVEGKENAALLSQVLLASTEPALVVAAFAPDTRGKGTTKTTSSDKIWSDWDGFVAKATDFRKQVVKVAEAGNDVTLDDMKALFGQCKACHDNYREK